MKPLKAIVCLAALSASVQCAQAREVPYDEVFSSDAGSITGITTCGTWTVGKASGRYRVIELYMEGQSFLYVDKVAIGADQTRFDVVKGIAITQIDDDHADIELRRLRCVATKGGITIRAQANDGERSAWKNIRIDLRAKDDGYGFSGL